MNYVNFKSNCYKFNKKFGNSLQMPLPLHYQKSVKTDTKNCEVMKLANVPTGLVGEEIRDKFHESGA